MSGEEDKKVNQTREEFDEEVNLNTKKEEERDDEGRFEKGNCQEGNELIIRR